VHDHLHYIDHVVVGIDDLQKGMAAIEEMTGVKPAYVVPTRIMELTTR